MIIEHDKLPPFSTAVICSPVLGFTANTISYGINEVDELCWVFKLYIILGMNDTQSFDLNCAINDANILSRVPLACSTRPCDCGCLGRPLTILQLPSHSSMTF